MQIINEPSVYIVGRQTIDHGELGRFLHDEGVTEWTTDTDIGAEKLVEVSGRLCYMSFSAPRPGGNKAYVNHILEVGHGSVAEHAVFSLVITGVSRSLTHELVRHRVMSYSQLSQRFVDESSCAFVLPPIIADDPELLMVWRNAVEHAQAAYKRLSDGLAGKLSEVEDRTLRRKMAREAARSVLPNATETKIFITGNARALRHFIELRGSIHADAEIRVLACKIAKVLREEAPNLFGDVTFHADGSVTTKYRKV
jgi:thymidylate synthase (FAD)